MSRNAGPSFVYQGACHISASICRKLMPKEQSSIIRTLSYKGRFASLSDCFIPRHCGGEFCGVAIMLLRSAKPLVTFRSLLGTGDPNRVIDHDYYSGMTDFRSSGDE